jgi:hypothetical protein
LGCPDRAGGEDHLAIRLRIPFLAAGAKLDADRALSLETYASDQRAR